MTWESKPFLFCQDNIAGAVAREIRNMDLNSLRDGIAYKAAWERAGSVADNHIAAASSDAVVMSVASSGAA